MTTRLLRLAGPRGTTPPRPDDVRRYADQRQLGPDGDVRGCTRDADANQQVVADVTRARSGGVRVLAEEAQPERDHEHGCGVQRKGVLRVDGREQERGRQQADARLKRAPEQKLLAKAWEERDGEGAGRPSELAEDVVGGGVNPVREVGRPSVARRVDLLDEDEERP